ncbi:hypothetical protein [Streptomyces sp. IMTB 2501]|uniref:hypothetical protein n=1 Tax=Streptomyces sp. IMTB 2501 TaxID=1776340 RepID=UPI0015BC61A7|nr:hypothetical protein [Streptomyces sp. IMTB 2501]
MPLLQRHAEAGHGAGEPGDGEDRVTEHGVAAALGQQLAAAGQPGVDRLQVELAGGAALADDVSGGGGVVRDGVGDGDPPVADPAVDQLQGGYDAFGCGQHIRLGAALVRQVVAEDEADLDFDARVAVPGDGRRAVRAQLHVVEQMAVVRLVHPHHPLHDGGRQADLVAAHLGSGGDAVPDVDELDLVGVLGVDLREGLGQRGDRCPAVLGGAQDLRGALPLGVREHGVLCGALGCPGRLGGLPSERGA